MLRKIINTSSSWITIPLRLALAAVFIAHGAQKVLGSFEGHGFKAWISGSVPFGFMRPAWLWLGAAALAELVGGVLILFGFLTRVGAFLIACVMVTAIVGKHWGSFFSPGGMEFPMSLLALCLALLIGGGGQLSVDRALSSSGGKKR
jgi:putative oxidoreductase